MMFVESSSPTLSWTKKEFMVYCNDDDDDNF